MALEAGSAMHEVFAAVRLWQLANVQNLPEHAENRAKELFGLERYATLSPIFASKKERADDPRQHLVALCFDVLHSSGYYDDPRDNIRTLTNMESATIVYVDEYLGIMGHWPVYVQDTSNPVSLIGVELTTDALLHFSDGKVIRYVGTADAVLRSTLEKARTVYLGENKTASRLDDSWRLSFEMSHQVTGYNVVTTARIKEPVYHTKVFGLRIQPGQQDAYESFEPQVRTGEMIEVWARWVYEGVRLYEMYDQDFESTIRMTHSCNRYFRPCALITFCADTPEGRELQVEDMVETDLSPSEQAVALGSGDGYERHPALSPTRKVES